MNTMTRTFIVILLSILLFGCSVIEKCEEERTFTYILLNTTNENIFIHLGWPSYMTEPVILKPESFWRGGNRRSDQYPF